MPKPEWGVKRTCTSCRARFYDLQRNPVVCPKCGAELDLSESMKLKRGGAPARAAPQQAEADEEELVHEAEEQTEAEPAAEEEGDAETPLAVEEEEEEEDEVAVPKKGKSEEDAELEDFEEDVLLEDEEEGNDEGLNDLDDDDLKNV